MIPDLPGERWLPVEGFEGIYEVSDAGRVKSLFRSQQLMSRAGNPFTRNVRERILRQSIDSRGYPTVTLWRQHLSKQARVANLVAAAFVGKGKRHEHLARITDRLSVILDQLIHTDRKTIEAMKSDRGTKVQGEDIGWAELTEADVGYIRANPDGLSQQQLADRFETTQGHVSRVMHRREWKHLP